MNILVVLVPSSVFLGLLALFAFIWTVRSHQYDDPEGAAERVLFTDADEENGLNQSASLENENNEISSP
ncbi:MAG: cbb3-type cytochrome oxidase assembly protein CcoS [Boseongicola sp.]|nr:cbb3-type cytochrome oxidase assembly protein CcoS [Boseongicola sp.]MDD9978753.1 cbb3-type cytochrome oxidase assembly protein CcoS [Boseongicola sp.]